MAESTFGIPAQDGPARDYFNHFASYVNANLPKYLLSAADGAALTLAAGNYSAAYDLADNAPTRNALTVTQKDEMRTACEALVRLYSIQIKYNQAVTTADKEAIGIRPPNPSRSPRPVPAVQPALTIIGSLTGSQTLRFRDPESEGRGKPFGAQTLELRVAIGETPVTDAELARPCGLFSRNPIGVAFDPSDNKKVATYFGRWANVRGEFGPWSNPVSMTIAA